MTIDLSSINTVYFVGIKGVGMASLACIAKQMGKVVLGSDVKNIYATDQVLHDNAINLLLGFRKSNIDHINAPKSSLVVYTGAHNGKNNIEVQTAKRRNIPTLTHGEALGIFMQSKNTRISVAGSHGKTTTTAMIAHILSNLDLKPSYAVGSGSIETLGSPGGYSKKGSIFVAEADEYVADPTANKTPRFMYQKPTHAVITSIDHDHPDVFASQENVVNAFSEFVAKMKPDTTLVIHEHAKKQLKKSSMSSKVLVYGPNSEYSVSLLSSQEGKTTGLITHRSDTFKLTLAVAGMHNLENALAAGIICHSLGVSWNDSVRALKSFRGTKRRFEKIAVRHGITIIDDYAHHPKEISATIKAARSWYKNASIAVLFQPHTYSRTKALFDDFVNSLSEADVVCVAPIFASAREEESMLVSSKKLVKKIKTKNTTSYYAQTPTDASNYFHKELSSGDILLTLGAGDIYSWHETLLTKL